MNNYFNTQASIVYDDQTRERILQSTEYEGGTKAPMETPFIIRARADLHMQGGRKSGCQLQISNCKEQNGPDLNLLYSKRKLIICFCRLTYFTITGTLTFMISSLNAPNTQTYNILLLW